MAPGLDEFDVVLEVVLSLVRVDSAQQTLAIFCLYFICMQNGQIQIARCMVHTSFFFAVA